MPGCADPGCRLNGGSWGLLVTGRFPALLPLPCFLAPRDDGYARRMTATPATASAEMTPAPGRRNRLGVVAFVLVMIVMAAPLVVTIVTAITGGVSGSTGSTADAIGWSVLGGFIVGAMALAVISPLGIVAVVLAIISLFRHRGRNGLGVWALVLGILPALIGPFLIPLTLGTLF